MISVVGEDEEDTEKPEPKFSVGICYTCCVLCVCVCICLSVCLSAWQCLYKMYVS